MNSEAALLESFTQEERDEAQRVEKEIDSVAEAISSGTKTLATNFAMLGKLLNEVKEKKYWLQGSYRTFGDYLRHIEEKSGLKHSQLYLGAAVARNLLPHISESDLYEMGITKAAALSRFVEKSGTGSVPKELVQAALDPKKKTDELKADVSQRLNEKPSSEKGKWFDIGGFYATEDERATVLKAFDVARGRDPIIPVEWPEYIQLKAILLKLSQEFLGTYA